ncbi:MAG: hypothetical protein ACRERU_17195 [Methylococcales bacterium]
MKTLIIAVSLILLFSAGTSHAQRLSSQEKNFARVLTISDRAGDARLVIPAGFQHRECALVIVSHAREAKPADELHNPPYPDFFHALGAAGYVLLLSEDSGDEDWGNAAALRSVERVFNKARERFKWNRTIFMLGLSMGGLPATLTAYRGTLKTPVNAVALIAARVNLADAYTAPAERRAAIEAAYATDVKPNFDPQKLITN